VLYLGMENTIEELTEANEKLIHELYGIRGACKGIQECINPISSIDARSAKKSLTQLENQITAIIKENS
jgi:hypothetical protein